MSESDFTQADYTFLSYNLVKNGAADTEISDISKWQLSSDMFDSQTLSLDLYGKTLDGVYQLIRKPDDFALSAVSETTNYYIMADIDMKGAEYDDSDMSNTYKLPKTYGGKFIGNGHTISNFTLKLTSIDVTYNSFGLFRTLTSGAEISDINFDNVTMSYNFTNATIGSYDIGILAGYASGTSKVNGVKVSGTFSYSCSDGVNVAVSDIGLIGHIDSSATVTDSKIESLKKLLPLTIRAKDAADNDYLISIQYSDIDGALQVESLIGFQWTDEFGFLPTNINIEKQNGNSFTISATAYSGTRRFDLSFVPSGTADKFTVTIEEITE